MHNMIYLIGRPTEINVKDGSMILRVQRTYKNEEGVYENDFIKCKISSLIDTNILDDIFIEDLIGIKGRLQVYDNVPIVVIDRLSYLCSKKEQLENEN